MIDSDNIPADVLAQIEAELAASKARILELLGAGHAEPETAVTEMTQARPLRLRPCSDLPNHLLRQRQRELHSLISSFEDRLGDAFDLGIVLQRFPEMAPLRLQVVTFFDSGAISFMGLDSLGRASNLYDTLDHFSVVLKKVRRLRPDSPRKRVEFYSVIEDLQ